MPPNGPQALVADHEPEVGEMSRRYLARAGLSVRVVATPGAALTALSAGAADLFVIDLTMPGLDVSAVRRALLAAAAAASARSGLAGPPACAPAAGPASAPAGPPAPGRPAASAVAASPAPAPAEPAARPPAGPAGLAPGKPAALARAGPPALAPPALAPVVFLLDRHGVRPRGLSDGLDCRRAFLARPFSPRALVEAATGLLRPPGHLPALPSRSAATSGSTGNGPSSATGRLSALSALSTPAVPGSLDAGAAGPVLDGSRRQVTVGGKAIGLTRTEWALLAALAGQPGQPLSRQSLLTALEAERGKRPTARAIDVYVTQLRAKLGTDVIQTVHGVGYALSWPGPDAPV